MEPVVKTKELVPLPRRLVFLGGRLNIDIYDGAGSLIARAGKEMSRPDDVAGIIDAGPCVDKEALQALRTSRWGREHQHLFEPMGGRIGGFALKGKTAAEVDSDLGRQQIQRYEAAVKRARADLPLGGIDRAFDRGSSMEVRDQVYALESSLRKTLREVSHSDFLIRINLVGELLHNLMDRDPDRVLLVLIYDSVREYHGYAIKHSLLVACMALLASREAGLHEHAMSIVRGAILMNVAMLEMQNELAQTGHILSQDERVELAEHTVQGRRMLVAAGFDDEVALDIVERHHQPMPLNTAFAELSDVQQAAQLVRAADVLSARMSPRRCRRALSAVMSAKRFFDETSVTDEAGAFVLKAIGLFPPGTMVRLSSMNVAIAVMRGGSVTTPVVACVMDAAGNLISRPTPVRLDGKRVKVLYSMAPEESNVKPSLEGLLVSASASKVLDSGDGVPTLKDGRIPNTDLSATDLSRFN